MSRISHDNNGTWIKEFKSTKNNGLVKKHYLDDATFLVLSLSVRRDINSGALEISINDKAFTDLSIYFGQYIAVHKNLSLMKRFYFDYDLSLNKKEAYTSTSLLTPTPGTGIQVLKTTGDNVVDFLNRNTLSTGSIQSSQLTTPLTDFYDLYFGYSYIRDIVSNYDSISNYEAVVAEQLSTVSEDCFNWVKIVNGTFDEIPSNTKSSTMLVDYRLDLKRDVLLQWIRANFSTIFEELTNSFGSDTLDFNLILYPPSSTGMQFEDVPNILAPSILNRAKIIPTVAFEVKKSIVDKAQKYFVIDFIDVATNLSIYTDNSYINPDSFTIDTSTTKLHPESFQLQSSIFEILTEIDYPDTKFIVTYTLPTTVSSYLSNQLNYKIIVKVSDLTSERSE